MSANVPHLVYCFGPGGSGKTSVAAALAVAGARQGNRVCCITIDPSKRLGSALGLQTPYPVDPVPIQMSALKGCVLDGLVIRVPAMLDRVVKELAPQKYAEITQNKIFSVMASDLEGLEHYMAIDVLHRIYTSEKYDVVIVDTPPTRHAINFLEAPDRMLAIFNQQFFKFFVQGYASIGKGSLFFVKDAYQLGARLLEKFFGMTFLNEMAVFFGYFQDVIEELRHRIQTTVNWTRDPSTACVLIGYEYMQLSEMNYYLGHIKKHQIGNRGFIFNQSYVNYLEQLPSRSGPEEGWVEAVKTRIDIQKQSISAYKKWAKVDKMPFLEMPFAISETTAQGVIQEMANIFLTNKRFLQTLTGTLSSRAPDRSRGQA